LSDQRDLSEFNQSAEGNSTEKTMSEWEERTFSDVVQINNYPSLEKGVEQTHVGMNQIEENVRQIQGTLQKEYSYSKPRFQNGDTLFARITPCLENGKTAFVDILTEDEAATGSTEFLVLSATEETLPKFVYYTVRRPDIRQFAIKRMTGSSGRQRVPTDVFDNITIKLPPIEEQERIVDILDSPDSKIELNRDSNETLEKLAHIYTWEHINEDFQSSDDPLKLKDIAEIEEERIKPKDYPDKNFHLYNFSSYDSKKHPELKYGSNIDSQKYAVSSNHVLVSKLNPDTKRIWRPGNAESDAVCSTEFVVLNPKEPATAGFVYEVAKSDNFYQYLRARTTGTSSSHQRVKKDDILDFEIGTISDQDVKSVGQFIEPLHQRNHQQRAENQCLEEIRDTLLPKLMSGEVRLPG